MTEEAAEERRESPEPSENLSVQGYLAHKKQRFPGTLQCRCSSQFENNYFTEMCSGSEAGSYLRLIDFVYHSTLGLRVIQKKRRRRRLPGSAARGLSPPNTCAYRGTSLIRNSASLGPYSRTMHRALWWS